MEQSIIQQAIERIGQMEQCFDDLLKAAGQSPEEILENASLKERLLILTQYYESGQWLSDYELDEKGLLPHRLKRGVLSQDAVYDFLERMQSIV